MQRSRQWIVWLVTGAKLGYLPIAPGTWGTLLGMGLIAPVMSYPVAHGIVTLLALFCSIWWVDLYLSMSDSVSEDPKEVIIDEIIGVWIALFMLPTNIFSFLVAFGVFRFFDIVKPFPVSYFDRKIKGSLGVVLDDVCAGLLSNILLQLGHHFLWD
ncbi:MAG: phosphatidylglycerophosphatase A [Bdellovibrionaceae bacterium]|nr:phosphatidylglycerophosphatase A [Pseudobdellovibrionaceae bacterium]MDW8189561.1 phosphatidylglycerophosphatase A [Pseudobdellovibrionaceae bacterium]